jgi:hypothetical protein
MVRVRLPILIYCDGSGNHGRHRQLFPVHVGSKILIRCELCDLQYKQRAQRFTDIVTALQEHRITELGIDAYQE